MHLSFEYEKKINEIAKIMGIYEPIIIRKMNYNSLRGFGYNNAFVYFTKWLNVIPLSSKPFLYVSEGFFEDLTSDEQLFLIGHELIHAKYRHLLYAPLVKLLIVLLIFLLVYLLIRALVNYFVVWYGARSYQRFLKFAIYSAVFFGINLAGDIFYARYKRSIEWQADRESLALLKSYDGGIAFLERCVREYRQSWHLNGMALFADHPSNYERRIYCLAQKSKNHLSI